MQKKSSALTIEISQSKLNLSIWNSVEDIEGCDVIKVNQSRRVAGGVACYIRKSLSCNHKLGLCLNTEIVFINIGFA